MMNKAKNVIFILLAGAPSHTDTFDLKVVNGTTPSTFTPDTVNGVAFPSGLMPKLGGMMNQFAIVRSMQAWALVHSLAQTWTQIGRNPGGRAGERFAEYRQRGGDREKGTNTRRARCFRLSLR